jgi:hypothetical protein
LNIDLRHAPLSIIQANLAGQWELRVNRGGVCGICSTTYGPGENVWIFSPDAQRLKQTYKGQIVTDTVLSWMRTRTFFSDSAFVLYYYMKQGTPNSVIADKVKNDTLILLDDAIDGITHYLIRD